MHVEKVVEICLVIGTATNSSSRFFVLRWHSELNRRDIDFRFDNLCNIPDFSSCRNFYSVTILANANSRQVIIMIRDRQLINLMINGIF